MDVTFTLEVDAARDLLAAAAALARRERAYVDHARLDEALQSAHKQLERQEAASPSSGGKET